MNKGSSFRITLPLQRQKLEKDKDVFEVEKLNKILAEYGLHVFVDDDQDKSLCKRCRLVKKLKLICTILTIFHTNKNGENKTKDIFVIILSPEMDALKRKSPEIIRVVFRRNRIFSDFWVSFRNHNRLVF